MLLLSVCALVFVVVAEPTHRRVSFLAAERRVIEKVVSVDERIEAAHVRRVGVVDLLSVAEEHTEAFPLSLGRTLAGIRVVIFPVVVLGCASSMVTWKS